MSSQAGVTPKDFAGVKLMGLGFAVALVGGFTAFIGFMNVGWGVIWVGIFIAAIGLVLNSAIVLRRLATARERRSKESQSRDGA